MDKKLKKEYDKKLGKITLRLSVKEKTILMKMMKDDGWENVAGFIKYSIFGETADAKYEKVLRRFKPEDISIVLKNLFEEVIGHLSYANHRYEMELSKLKALEGKIDEKKLNRYISMMSGWRNMISDKTDQIYEDCKTIMKYLDIKIEKKDTDYLRFVPDSVLDKARRDWDDTSSPEMLEAARRDIEKFLKENPKAIL